MGVVDNNDGQGSCQTISDGTAGCQTTDPTQAGYCSGGGTCVGGVCTNGGSGCQTTDPTDTATWCPHPCVNGSCSISGGADATSNCCTTPIKYKGLDEFRSQYNNSYGVIKSAVERTITINNKQIQTIDKNSWLGLRLIDQLTYFKNKIDEVKKTIQDDEDVLNNARAELGKCYLAIPEVDFLQKYSGTNQAQRVILTQKFTDPTSGSSIDSSKYCAGFNYDNSSCLKKCNDACPDSSQPAIASYQGCTTEACIEAAYKARPCTNYSGSNPPANFGVCVASCQTDCTASCAKKYIACSSEYTMCASLCSNNSGTNAQGNSQCVLNNASKCLFGDNQAKIFANCTSQTTDQGNSDYCIKNAYLCKNGSDEYAGYPDCSQPSTTCLSYTDQSDCEDASGCTWGPGGCYKAYSTGFYYNNPSQEKCYNATDNKVEPYSPPKPGTTCYSATAPATSACKTLCPEVTKCSADSYCPACPCDQINQTLTLSVPSDTVGSYSTSSQTVSANDMVGPQCNSYSYNNDPLTFYCENNWWNDPARDGLNTTPIGTGRACSKTSEVPVGQTVDDAELWADKLIGSIDGTHGSNNEKSYLELGNSIDDDIAPLISQMIKIGKANVTSPIQDYCKCAAEFENYKPVCKTGCSYSYWRVCDPNSGGCWWDCACTLIPCSGGPCQQVIDYFAPIWGDYKDLKTDFIDLYTATIVEPRSDIIKELAYSRQATNSCSIINKTSNAAQRLLSCTRARNEIISPISTGQITLGGKTINGYCYGKNLGTLFNKDLTDNWFCCEQFTGGPAGN